MPNRRGRTASNVAASASETLARSDTANLDPVHVRDRQGETGWPVAAEAANEQDRGDEERTGERCQRHE